MSSSDSNTENLDWLKEAMDMQFINDSMFDHNKVKGNNTNTVGLQCSSPPSLRRNPSNEDDSYNLFKVSPEFQKYVSKQLSDILEKQLSEKLDNDITPTPQKMKIKGGIKLLKCSAKYLKISKVKPDEKKFKRRLEDLELNNEENCKLVAVSTDDILKGHDVKCWSKRSKAPVYNYCKDFNGSLVLKETPFK